MEGNVDEKYCTLELRL